LFFFFFGCWGFLGLRYYVFFWEVVCFDFLCCVGCFFFFGGNEFVLFLFFLCVTVLFL